MSKYYIPKYCDSKSILLINRAGNMKKLYCPFKVLYKGNDNYLLEGASLWVDQVAIDEKGELTYFILNQPYHFGIFEIKAKF